ncbi:MAG: adenylate/guanylate cyclase domain-containing protein [Bdellovibrio sp.]|nr:MAG: adenylate/guanylate cyclase domain-containing protein [Bdellovibrio sp.]
MGKDGKDGNDGKGGNQPPKASKPQAGSPGQKAKKDHPLFGKWVQPLIERMVTPLAVGLYVTVLFLFFALTFYKVRSQNEAGVDQNKLTSIIFRTIEALDFLLVDTRFQIRGPVPMTDSQTALVAVDDESLEIVGRWPWSRDLMAQLLETLMKYGVKAVGLDIIWSEAQRDGSEETLLRLEKEIGASSSPLSLPLKEVLEREKKRLLPDDVLAETLKKYQDRVVLGVFPTDENLRFYKPYSDYCRNEAFNFVNGSVFVRPDNITLAVEDTSDLFEPVKFNLLFGQTFADIAKKSTEAFLSRTHRASIESLTAYEKNRLKMAVNVNVMKYCDRWLVPEATTGVKDNLESDEYYDTWLKFFGFLGDPAKALAQGYVTGKLDLLAGLGPEAAVAKFKSSVLSHPVPQYSGWTINIEKFHAASLYSGSFKAEQDDDGKIRKNPLFYRTGNRIGSSFVPSLAMQTYLVAHPGYQAQVEIGVDPRHESQKTIRSFRIIDVNQPEANQEVMKVPVDGQGRLRINYAGPRESFANISAKDLLNDSPEMKINQLSLESSVVKKADYLKDKIILIGATAVGIYDLRVTPFEKNYPGPETHVTVLDNLLRQNFIRIDPSENQKMLWFLAVLGILTSAGIAFSGPLTGLIFVFASELALVFLDQFLLKKGLVATMILPALLVVSIYVVMILYKYFTEERKKKELRNTFSKYVSPSIVDEILKSPENIELGGRKQRMTVFFSDVRGFTTISEKLDPQVLADVLNRYLTPMTEIVFANKGTLDKYMGDALMAFFGAPIAYPDHAKYACRSALQSLAKLRAIQKEFADAGLPHIDIGIGINTSDMSVGNMGSDIVRNYTVMGDGVNLGSRLEGINKEYGTRIIISQFTNAEIVPDFTTREIDWVRVKGKNEPVRIFELICEGSPDETTKSCLTFFREGFDLYHQRDFAAAKLKFEQALKVKPDDQPTQLYIERCDELLAEPPPADWDGVYIMKTK